MKYYNLSVIIFALGIFFPSVLSAQDCRAKVSIKTDQDSSSIFLNNKFAGIGSASLELAKGAYEIKAVEPAWIWDAKTVKDSLVIDNCSSPKTVSLVFNNSLYLQTLPEDAPVYSGDSLIGYTPLFIPERYNNVELKKPGFDIKNAALNHSLADQTFRLDYKGIKNNNDNFFKGPLFKILMGSLVALGTATAYFKLKADDRFSQYQASGDESLLSETRKLDLISGITLGALEINFGVLIYFFLSD